MLIVRLISPVSYDYYKPNMYGDRGSDMQSQPRYRERQPSTLRKVEITRRKRMRSCTNPNQCKQSFAYPTRALSAPDHATPTQKTRRLTNLPLAIQQSGHPPSTSRNQSPGPGYHISPLLPNVVVNISFNEIFFSPVIDTNKL